MPSPISMARHITLIWPNPPLWLTTPTLPAGGRGAPQAAGAGGRRGAADGSGGGHREGVDVVDDAVAVRAHQAHAGAARELHELRLALAPLGGAHLGKARAVHGSERHAARRAFL